MPPLGKTRLYRFEEIVIPGRRSPLEIELPWTNRKGMR
jgi:hypothetical protein